jgi:Galactosyltransferase
VTGALHGRKIVGAPGHVINVPEHFAKTRFARLQTTADTPGKTYDRRRKAIRDTWLSKVANFPEFEARFVVGVSADGAALSRLHDENAMHNDILFLQSKARDADLLLSLAVGSAACRQL